MPRMLLFAAAAVMATLAIFAAQDLLAAGADLGGDVQQQQFNVNAVIMFLIFVGATLGITYWAARRTKSASDFYAAGGGITGFQNGLAIAGDYMSAASFLGISGLVFLYGYDGLIFSMGFLVGWPVILFLIAERLRNLGKYTFADVACYRFQQKPVRSLAATGGLLTVIFYLIAQMVGSGKLIQLLFGLPYSVAVLIIGGLMIIYVTLGGMLATTWVQIIKAVLLLAGATFMAGMVLFLVGFDVEELFRRAIEASTRLIETGPNAGEPVRNTDVMAPGGLIQSPIDAVSVGLALMFGTAGLPHILMRFFTVKDAQQARKSVFYATGFIGYFYILTFIIGFGAIVFLSPYWLAERGLDVSHFLVAPETDPNGLIGGNNMAAIHLSNALGGSWFLGFISAVAFATILAVVSGLTLAGASAVSHDLYATVIRKGQATEMEEIRVSRIATVCLGVIAILLGIAFENINVAFMVMLAFTIAASCNFPVLLMSMSWSKMTTRGAVIGGYLGLAVAAVLMIVSRAIWVDVIGMPAESVLFPYASPALFSMVVAFVGIYIFSKMDKSEVARAEIVAFEEQYVRSQTGIGAERATVH